MQAEAQRIAHDGAHDQPDPVQREIERVLAAEAANGSRAGPGCRPTWQIKLDARMKLMQNGRPERDQSWAEKEVTRMNFNGGCKPIPLPTIKGESEIMNPQSTTVPLVNLIADISPEPPTPMPNSNGKAAIFEVLDGVALGWCNFKHNEERERMMREAAGLLDQGYVPGPSVTMGDNQRGLWFFDSVRFKQLRPTMTAHERASERFSLWQQDQLSFGEQAAASVRPAAEEAIS